MRLWWVLAGLLVMLGLWDVAAAEAPGRRVALVIANADYANTTSLKNPISDAELIKASLVKAGFEVVPADPNLGIAGFRSALRRFQSAATGAEAALVYYAGHGIEAQGKNWLIPVDATLQNDADLDYEAIDLNLVLHATEGAAMRVVVLDACRNNPFGKTWRRGVRAVEQGLAPVDVDNVLVIYAAAPGQTASDGTGANSPFAKAMAARLPQAGLPVQMLGGMVRDDVLKATGDRQRPFISASITGAPFMFVEGNVTVNVSPPAASAAPAFDPRAMELAYWSSVASTNDAVQLRAYLRRYPAGEFADVAKAKIASLDRPPPAAARPAAEPQGGAGRAAADIGASAQRLTAAAPGTVFRDCADACPEMVIIPAGGFFMGSPASEANREQDESPRHLVRIASFATGRFPVTVAEFSRFVAETGHDAGDRWRHPGVTQGPDHPVVGVAWTDAEAYVAWLSRRTGKPYRLLSESEYEYVQRAGSAAAYAFGDTVGVNLANCIGCGSRWDGSQTAPVNSYAPSAFGLYGATGNAWSWTQDCYAPTYDATPRNEAANLTGDCRVRVMRGGSFDDPPQNLRAARRGQLPADTHNIAVGFRVAQTF